MSRAAPPRAARSCSSRRDLAKCQQGRCGLLRVIAAYRGALFISPKRDLSELIDVLAVRVAGMQVRPDASAYRRCADIRERHMTKRTVFAAAAAIFAAGSFATAAHADGVKCSGVNACKWPERLQDGLVVLQGPECLQGSGLDRDHRRRELHGPGWQGPLDFRQA